MSTCCTRTASAALSSTCQVCQVCPVARKKEKGMVALRQVTRHNSAAAAQGGGSCLRRKDAQLQTQRSLHTLFASANAPLGAALVCVRLVWRFRPSPGRSVVRVVRVFDRFHDGDAPRQRSETRAVVRWWYARRESHVRQVHSQSEPRRCTHVRGAQWRLPAESMT